MTKEELKKSYDDYWLSHNQHMRGWLDEHYDVMSDYDKFWYTVDVYQDDGEYFPRSKIIRLKSIKPTDNLKYLDPSLSGEKEITVYRGHGSKALLDPKTSLSWTTDRNVAIWFYAKALHIRNKLKENGAKAGEDENTFRLLVQLRLDSPICYQATINVDRIIATVGGTEHEILQHRGIKDVISFVPTDEEIKIAQDKHESDD